MVVETLVAMSVAAMVVEVQQVGTQVTVEASSGKVLKVAGAVATVADSTD